MQYDESRSPLVVVSHLGASTDSEFEAFLRKIDATLGRERTLGVLMDLRRADRPSPIQRKRLAQWTEEKAGPLKRQCLGMSFVIDRAIIRGALTAILWLHPLPMPHGVFGKYEESEAWIIERLEAAGMRVPGRTALG